MRLSTSCCVSAILLISLNSAALAADADYPKTEADLKAAYQALHWQKGQMTYSFPTSNSELKLPDHYNILTGADASREVFLANGSHFAGVEAVVVDDSGDNEVDFDFTRDGHVQDKDWTDVDAADFLKQLQAGQIDANKERVANGKAPLTVIGWLQQPTYDAATHTASWALELSENDQHFANAKALRLSRDGYSELTWIGSLATYHAASGRPAMLTEMLADHSYKPGARYADFKQGDKVAEYGLAALVAGVIGVKVGKGLIAAALAFLAIAGKKGAVLGAIFAGGLMTRLKSIFRRRQKSTSLPSNPTDAE